MRYLQMSTLCLSVDLSFFSTPKWITHVVEDEWIKHPLSFASALQVLMTENTARIRTSSISSKRLPRPLPSGSIEVIVSDLIRTEHLIFLNLGEGSAQFYLRMNEGHNLMFISL